jgi:hypothetical protein
MKNRGSFAALALCIFLPFATTASTWQPNSDPRDTYYLSSPPLVSEDVGEIIVTVRWIPYPGNTNGWVRFRTMDGSAQVGYDFGSGDRILYFSLETNRVSFPVRIIMDDENEREEYFMLNLLVGSSINQAIWHGVKIANVQVGPKLYFSFTEDGSLRIVWRDDGIPRVLEKSSLPSGPDWIAVGTPQSTREGSGYLYVTDVPAGPAGFYRLRQVE